MTFEELYKKLKSLGVPVAYDHFDKEQKAPFIAFLDVGKNTFIADGCVYTKNTNIQVELYTEEKALELEEKLESIFDQNHLIWSDEATTFIEDESLYEHIYEIRI